MSKFKRTCQQCFQEDGLTIPLIKEDGEWVCPRNPEHVTENHIIVS